MALGIPGAELRLAIPESSAAELEMDAIVSVEPVDSVLRDLAGAGTDCRNGMSLHKAGLGGVRGEALQPNEVRRAFGDFVKVDIGLVVAPGVVNDIAGLERVRLLALGGSVGLGFGAGIERCEKGSDLLLAALLTLEGVMPVGLGAFSPIGDGVRLPVCGVGVNDSSGMLDGLSVRGNVAAVCGVLHGLCPWWVAGEAVASPFLVPWGYCASAPSSADSVCMSAVAAAASRIKRWTLILATRVGTSTSMVLLPTMAWTLRGYCS